MKKKNLIIPKEKKVIVYSVLQGEIINDVQKKEYPDGFTLDITKIQEKRFESFSLTSVRENLFSFVYVNFNGEVESEINVIRPKYGFHENFNDSVLV